MIYSYVIKFMSLDGLVRYEEQTANKRPDDYIERRAIIAPMAASIDADPFPVSSRYMRRTYHLIGHGIHPETGQLVYEYKEQL